MSWLKAVFSSITALILALSPVVNYKEGVVGQPSSFLPSQAKTQHEKTVSSLIYRGLYKYDIYGALLPDLVDTFNTSSDDLVYTITLKPNQYWSDGSKITADDLIYTSYKVADLSGVATDKVNDLTVRYTLPNKFSPFESLLTVGVMKSNAEEKEKPLTPVTSGDWQVVRVERTGKLVRVVTLRTRKEAYNIKKIQFKYYSNDDELATASKLGEIDGFLTNKTLDLQNSADYKFPTQGIYYALYFNLRDESMQDLALRQKLEKVLNVDELTYDRGILAQGPLSRSVFTDTNLNFNRYDKAFTEDLTGTSVKITVPDIESHVDLVNKIKQIWQEKLNVSVTVDVVDPEKMIEDVVTPRKFQILFYGQEVGRDPDRYVNWHSTQKDAPGLNLSGFEQVRADRALEEGRNELDNTKRIIHYNEFQKTVFENTPAIFLYHPFVHFYVSKYIEGIGEKYTFTQADRFLDLVNWHRTATN